MKHRTFVLVCFFVAGLYACSPSVNSPVTIPNSLIARWTLLQTQAPGIGGAGIWSTASPAGQWMELQGGGTIAGTAFPMATGYQVIDSVTLRINDPSQNAGYRLFTYRIDTVARTLTFYIKPPNGVLCFEGCGGYGFGR